jgi:hypothetical protein
VAALARGRFRAAVIALVVTRDADGLNIEMMRRRVAKIMIVFVACRIALATHMAAIDAWEITRFW